MPGVANRASYTFESQPSDRKPRTPEASPQIPRPGDPLSQPEPWAGPRTDTEPVSSRLVSFSVPERLLNAREVASRLGVSERWVRDHTTRRFPKLRGVKLGTLMRYRKADVEEFMEKLTTSRSSMQPRFGG
jgi:excisionase family DNA binding protein